MSLTKYRHKRNFTQTPEPRGKRHNGTSRRRFVVQKHAARRLHYDFRLELEGVLKSWAVPKGPSLDPAVRALAVEVEDHPMEYGSFEGVIPAGQYGGGTVMLWDRGHWESDGDALRGYQQGKLRFRLEGEKLHGSWTLSRMSGKASEGGKNWLLIKRNDEFAHPADEYDLLTAEPNSIATGRPLDQIAAEEGDEPDKAVEQAEEPAFTLPDAKLDEVSGAEKRSFPKISKPQLPTLVETPPAGDQWLHELKLDGYRILVEFREGKVRLVTRNGNDWTDRFPAIAAELQELPMDSALFDGEVVVLRRDGTTDFQALQNSLRGDADEQLLYFVFDLLYLNGYDLRQVPLRERKALLRGLIADGAATLRYSGHIQGQGEQILTQVCQAAAEGIVSKRADSVYHGGRSRSWLKVKCLHRQEFVVGGYTDPSGSRQFFGSLLLGYYNAQRQLVYCGKVGTGFNSQSLSEIAVLLRELRSKQSPFEVPPARSESAGAHWLAPRLVVEVQFSEWTGDGRLRHPSFQGLREDKEPHAVGKERPKAMNGASTTRNPQAAEVAGVTLTNPERVLYAEQGITKRMLAEYYESIADWVLPQLVGRPLSIVRCPQGQQAQCFFQKHVNESVPAGLEGIEVEEDSGPARYLAIDDLAGLITLVQLGVLEIHPWGCRGDLVERPDRIVIDLDPSEEVAWDRVVAAAWSLRELFDDLKLASFVRTTGGKGLHVVVPIARRSSWEEVKQFAHDVADYLVRQAPEKFVATSSKAKRRGKIYVDYLRNSRGATAIASYSTRARPGAPVATPLVWEELTAKLDPAEFNLNTVPRRLRKAGSRAWEEIDRVKQALTKAMRAKIAAL